MSETVWDTYSQAYSGLERFRAIRQARNRACGELDPQPQETILDACCGDGSFLTRLAQRKVINRFGFDGSSDMIAVAAKHCPGSDLRVHDGNEALPWESRFFDKVACLNALYTLKDPLAFLQELYRVLKSNGRLVLSNPVRDYNNGWVLWEESEFANSRSHWEQAHHSAEIALQLITTLFPSVPPEELRYFSGIIASNTAINQQVAQFHFFHPAELVSLVSRAGFKVTHTAEVHAGVSTLIVAQKGA